MMYFCPVDKGYYNGGGKYPRCPQCGGEWAECPVDEAFDQWKRDNPKRKAHEFGLELRVATCAIDPRRTHIRTDGQAAECDCRPLT